MLFYYAEHVIRQIGGVTGSRTPTYSLQSCCTTVIQITPIRDAYILRGTIKPHGCFPPLV